MWRASDHGSGVKIATKTSAGQGAPLRRLSGGREMKTRQGNRQWISRRVVRGFSQTTPVRGGVKYGFSVPRRRLSGHELKTRHGNRQWVARRVVMRRRSLQLVAGNHRRGQSRAAMTAHLRAKRGKSLQFVSMSGQKFVMDSGGRRMKRLSLSSPSSSSSLSSRQRLRSRGRSVSDNHHLPTATTSVKQYLARYVFVSPIFCAVSIT